MNTPKTFQLGWGLFAGCFLTGAYIGWNRAMDAREVRKKELVGQVADRNAALDKLEQKWRAEGTRKFKSDDKKKTPAPSPTEGERVGGGEGGGGGA